MSLPDPFPDNLQLKSIQKNILDKNKKPLEESKQ
jgi:hypothetical protein